MWRWFGRNTETAGHQCFPALDAGVQRAFAQAFVTTLGMNMFLDLRKPRPAAY